MTVSTQDYADLSQVAYHQPLRDAFGQYKTVIFDGVKYQPLEYLSNPATGYQGTIYQRKDTGEIVVAHRGTEPPWQDIKDTAADAAMVFQHVNPQVKDAEALTRHALGYANQYAKNHPDLPPPVVTITGHSLGGTLAQITAHEFGLRAETFNPYGAVSLRYGVPTNAPNIVNHVIAADPVSAASPQPGQVRMYASQAEVLRLGALGYTNDGLPSLYQQLAADPAITAASQQPVKAALIGAFSSHGIGNFANVDDQGHPHQSILADPQAQQCAAQHTTLFEQYRADVQTVRSGISLAGNTAAQTLHAANRAITGAEDVFLYNALNLSNAANQSLDRVGLGPPGSHAHPRGFPAAPTPAAPLPTPVADSAQFAQSPGSAHYLANRQTARQSAPAPTAPLPTLAADSAQFAQRPDGAPHFADRQDTRRPALMPAPSAYPASDPRNPGHRDHALYQSVRDQLIALHDTQGITLSSQELDNRTAATMADARQARMRSVTSMVFAEPDGRIDTSRVGIFEGDPDDRAGHAAVIDMNRAKDTPAEQSFAQFAQNTQALDQSIQRIHELNLMEQQQSRGMSR
jgi:hypothetical protein